MATTYKKAKRSTFQAFLNTSPGETTETWSRMGKGITGQTVQYNPQVTTEQYIDEDAPTTDVDSYQPTIQTPQTVHVGEPCFEFVDALRKKRASLADARTEILLVDAYSGSSGSYRAEKNVCSIQIDDFGGDAGKPLSITYTVNLIGNPVEGTFSTTNSTFTPSGGK